LVLKNKNRGYQQLRVWQDAVELYRLSGQITEEDFESLDQLAYKLENGLLKLVESLERKKLDGDWIDSLIVKELNEDYGKVD